MARLIHDRDIGPILNAAKHWINACLIGDGSVFSPASLWTSPHIEEVQTKFVERPDTGEADFMTKLEGQMRDASASAKQILAEMLWALLLFPSNVRSVTKRQQVVGVWKWSGGDLNGDHNFLAPEVLRGVGSGGPGFNTYRPNELAYLVALANDLKRVPGDQRRRIFDDYDAFMAWIEGVPQVGFRQFRHMLRYFAFPDRVERISSNNDRRKILEAFGVSPQRETRRWSDRDLDHALYKLRTRLQEQSPSELLDFYGPPLKEKWAADRRVRTPAGEVTVVVPTDDEDEETPIVRPEARQSLRIQASLSEIGAIMGFRIWLPRNDRGRVRDLVSASYQQAFLEDLPLNYDEATLDTIEQIDVIWLKNRAIIRAFEVEHTTAVYSGLLRMADLLALQPNMDIQLHIVAPEERREKVFHEMLRPVFSLLDRGPLSDRCTFLSYDNVLAIRDLQHLEFTNEKILSQYEERPDL
jgi:hypothetical protein